MRLWNKIKYCKLKLKVTQGKNIDKYELQNRKEVAQMQEETDDLVEIQNKIEETSSQWKEMKTKGKEHREISRLLVSQKTNNFLVL